MYEVPQIGVPADAGVAKGLIEVELNGLGDDMRVDGQEDDKGRTRIREQHRHCVQYRKDLKSTKLISWQHIPLPPS